MKHWPIDTSSSVKANSFNPTEGFNDSSYSFLSINTCFKKYLVENSVLDNYQAGGSIISKSFLMVAELFDNL